METTYINNDKLLAGLLSQGDKSAFEEIFNRYWVQLFNSAYKRLKNSEQCKDLLQDLFADLWIRRENVQIDNLSAYLHTAIRYQVFKLAAKNKVLPSFFELYETIGTSPFNADSNLKSEELEKLTEAWFNSLPKKRREIFLLHFKENLSTREIADHLHISQKTVQNQLGTANLEFRKKLNLTPVLLFFASLP